MPGGYQRDLIGDAYGLGSGRSREKMLQSIFKVEAPQWQVRNTHKKPKLGSRGNINAGKSLVQKNRGGVVVAPPGGAL